MSGRECYNLTVTSDIPCKYCSSAYLLSQFTTDSNCNYVKFDNNEVHIFIKEDLRQCGTLVFYSETIFAAVFTIIYPLENNMECEDPEQNTDSTTSTPRVEQTFNTTVTAAVVIPAVVLIIVLAVLSVIIVYFCLKKKKVKASDMTL